MNVRKKLSRFQYMAQDVLVNDEEAILMMNGQGEIMEKEEFDELVRLGQRFYGSENVSQWISEQNAINRWRGHPLLDTPKVDGKYTLPKAPVQERKFKPDLKRNWSFTCQWCQKKVSSKTDSSYYRVHANLVTFKTLSYNCCSEACAENLWYELLIDWIKEENLTDAFHTDKHIQANSPKRSEMHDRNEQSQ